MGERSYQSTDYLSPLVHNDQTNKFKTHKRKNDKFTIDLKKNA